MEGALPRGRTQPFAVHLTELRQRLTYSVGAVLVAGSLAYGERDWLVRTIVAPLHGTIYYTSPSGGFDFVVSLCLAAGAVFALPVILYNVLRFVEPALPAPAIESVGWTVAASYLLALLGAFVAYRVALPESLRFLTSFTYAGHVQALIGSDPYFSFALFYILGFALIFQLPVLMLLANRLRPIAGRDLMAAQRYVILVSFILAAVINPAPDPVTQTMTAVPLIGLYEVGVGAVLVDSHSGGIRRLMRSWHAWAWLSALAVVAVGIAVIVHFVRPS